MMRVVISAAAEDDLTDIAVYIAQDSPIRAMSFVDELEGKANSSAQTPLKGIARDHLWPGARLLVHGAYGIYYLISDQTVVVLRVLHSARDVGRGDFT